MEFKISVIIPVYNVRNKIYKCLDSIKKQTFKEFEVLFIDDGSRDDSIYFARDYLKYTDINYRIIKKKTGGISSARNLGIDEAKGDYILFLDSDDYIDDDLLKDFYDKINETDSDIVYCGYAGEDDNGNRIVTNMSNLKEGNYSGRDATLGLIYGFSHTSIISSLFRRELIVKNNIRFDENRKFAEDIAFEIKAYAHAEKVCCIKKVSTYFIKWDKPVVNNASKSYLDTYYSNVETLEYLKKNFNDEKLEKAMSEYRIPTSIVSVFSEFAGKAILDQVLDKFLDSPDVKEYLKQLKVHKLERTRIKYYILGKSILKMPNATKVYYTKLRKK